MGVGLADVIPPTPALVSTDLADAALRCDALVRARRLADWVGSGRELTATGVLRPAAAAEACQALGISLPNARLRSALDVGELMRDWTIAADAGFVVIDGRRARAAADLVLTEPEFVLSTWVRVAAQELGVPEEPCPECLGVLHKLTTEDRPVSMEELVLAAAEAESDTASGEPCPDCGEIHDVADFLGMGDLADDEYFDEPDAEDHAMATVAGLAALGAAVAAGGAVRLTPLGSMLATAIFEGCAPAPDAGAAELALAVSEVPLPVAMTMGRPWLEARSAEAAVDELLGFAESASGELRFAALAFAGRLGLDGTAAAWREWAKRPGFGAYARRWLTDQGEQVTPDPNDEAWLAVDALSVMLDSLPEMMLPFPLAAILQEAAAADLDATVEALHGSGHPAEADVVARLTGGPRLTLLQPAGTAGQTVARGRRSPASTPRGGL
jgi:hypothetical protein